jgi:thiol-disulfide isomerase/thioredoxin
MTQKTTAKPGAAGGGRSSTLWWIIGGVIGIALIVLLAISIAGEEPIDDTAGFGTPVVEGDALPAYTSGQEDPAVGQIAPTVQGEDWNGNAVSIEPDGTPKIVIFLAHWCPHCQAEVPVIQQWVDEGNLPDDVELVSVSTGANQLRDNWPPQEWLEREGWTAPVIMDDEIGTVAGNYGMSATPMFVVLDGENTNLGRITGELPVDALNTLVQVAQDSIEG